MAHWKKCSLNLQLVGQRRRWESNPLETALQAVALPSGSGTKIKECPRQESNLVYDLRRVACIHHTPRTCSLPRRGIEPRPTASKTVTHPPHSQGIYFPECPDPDSNQDLSLRRVQCDPLHHRDVVFLKGPTTGFAPA